MDFPADLTYQSQALTLMIQLTINGQSQQFEAPMNVAQLIDHLELHGKRIAIERNGEIVPRSLFSEQMLAHGDQLEVVVAVGGG
jgi:sulfur carrier protein